MDYFQYITKAISEDFPCGEDLEDDASFQNFFFIAQGKAESFDGKNTIPAEPPDWNQVKKQATDYLEKTKDIALICILSQSILNTEGIIKFADCIGGLSHLLSEQWLTIYPPIDEDDGSPQQRLSALGELLNKAFILSSFKTAVLLRSKVLGTLTLNKVIDDSTEKTISETEIIAMFKDSEQETRQATFDALVRLEASFTNINNTIISNSGAIYSIEFDSLTSLISQAIGLFKKYDSDLEKQEESTVENDVEIDVQQTTNKPLAVSREGVTCRADVVKQIDLILSYYAEYEPSSPVPLFLNRAKKLVDMDFLEIMNEIASDGVQQVQGLSGVTNE